MRFCRSRARTDSLTVAALKRAAPKPNRLPHGRGSETAARSADGRSGQIAESARPTAIPNDTSKKRGMAICQPLAERGDTPAAAEAVALVSPSA